MSKVGRWEVRSDKGIERFNTESACRAYMSTFGPDDRVTLRDTFSGKFMSFGPTPMFHSMAPENKGYKSRRVSKITARFMLQRNDDGNLAMDSKTRAMYEKIAGDSYKKADPWKRRKDESQEQYIARINKMANAS